MSVTYRAKVREYRTNSQDIWDIIALKCYGDERCMHHLQDANFEHRFVGFFQADVLLKVPPEVIVENNLKAGQNLPNIAELLPWR